MSWVPPGGGGPVGPPPAAPEPVQPSQLPTAPPPAVVSSAAAVAPVATPTTASASVRTAVITAVVGAIVAGGLIGGIGTGLSMANAPTYPSDPYEYPDDPASPSGGDYSELAQGEPGPPTAVEPTVCDTTCFGELAAERAILDDEVFADQLMPTSIDVWNVTSEHSTADFALPIARGDWTYAGYTPDECFVTWSESPLVEPLGVSAGPDFVAPLTQHASDQFPETVLTQSVRLFPDSASADQYMTTVDDGLDGCTRYYDDNGYAADTVTREPLLHQPGNVAMVGFVRSWGGIRYYVMDLQRGNLVIRSVAYSDGGIDDTSFRVLMQKQAEVLGTLPVG